MKLNSVSYIVMAMPLNSQPRTDPPVRFSYAGVLAAEARGAAKGARTAQKIRIAACTLLERAVPGALTIADICREAGIAAGTFYLHFADQARLLDDLLLGFTRFLQTEMIGAGRASPREPVRAATEAYCRLFEENRGLMKCLIHHLDSFPAARDAFHRLNREWIDTVAAAARRRMRRASGGEGGGDTLPEDELRRRIHALGGMTDQYLSSLLLSREPGLVAVSGDRAATIATLTTIWERGLRP